MALQLVVVPSTKDSPMRLKDLNLKRAFQRGDIDVETCLFALQKNVKQRLVEWEAEAPQDEAPQDEVPRHATCAGIAYDTHLNAIVRCCTDTLSCLKVPLEDESIFPPEDGDDGARCEDASLDKGAHAMSISSTHVTHVCGWPDDGDFVPTYQSPREAVVVRTQSELDTPGTRPRVTARERTTQSRRSRTRR